ncbi:Phage terminase, endonuclease subunit [Pseudomonas chlororaphis subsp. aureofaciens]|uniref:phage terminase small subunit n=1 Tax=Pseudomonas chlororaphis TaxID=587753 RepID=UPI000F55E811|nr:terminase endonuclease subunit [Pseudomonas chlororaphis]AZD84768.1 Phage terminase, endonuclease subunit [Pseudomonas chlororaphis subsp. aureofaciens]
MTNPCRRHFQRVTAAVAAAAVAGPAMTMEGANIYELHLAKLQQDYLRLKQVQSTEGKAELKRQLLPEYQPYVEGVLAEGKGAQDQVLTTLMVWRMDASDFAGALDIAAYVIEHQLLMPDRFERTTGTIVAEEIAEAALKAQKAGGSFDLDLLLRTEQITAKEDMPDQARAKLHLAIGKALSAQVADDAPASSAQQPLEQAKTHLARAIELHTNCGGKKDLERVERLLKKHAAPGS